MAANGSPLVSLVIPCFNEEEVFPFLQKALDEITGSIEKEYGSRCEILFIDDGSRDRTWELITKFSERDERVRGLSLSRNFGHQAALTCGYDLAKGDAVVCMDADLQDPPEVILEMVRQWQNGYDVVYAVRTAREGETWFKRMTASVFYRIMCALGGKWMQKDSGDFRLMSRRSLDALIRLREHHRFIRGMVGWIGFKTTTIPFERRARHAGETKYPFRKMMRLALDAIFSFSYLPLRIASYLAIAMLSLVFFYIVGSIISHFLFGTILVRGWTSIIMAVVFVNGLTLLCLGVMGEYVGRLYDQAKGRPLYLIQEKTNESMVREKRMEEASFLSNESGIEN